MAEQEGGRASITELLGVAPTPQRSALPTFVTFSLIGLTPELPHLLNCISPAAVANNSLCNSVLTTVAFLWIGDVETDAIVSVVMKGPLD